MAELLFFRDGELQMRSPLRSDRVVLGRASEADFTLPDRGISRLQCEIVKRPNGFAIVDLSGRGTPVSSRTANDRGTLLKDGDEIRLGTFAVVFSALEVRATTPEITRQRATESATEEHAVGTGAVGRARLRTQQAEGDAIVPLRAEDGFTLVVGTNPEGPRQLKLHDRFVSTDHFRIQFRDGHWVLTDRHSKNGTFVDGVHVIEAVLGERATIRAGETLLAFETEGVATSSDEPLPGLITRDPSMQPVIELVRRVAPSAVSVAIHGETGAGKEVIARAIHLLSPRHASAFVAINCGAISRDTVESELFGHEKGAFTGADRARAGAFEEADGGTLFLDEIGDLPASIQVKLLRTLERGEIRRLGASRTQTVNVRIISATHHDLLAAVEEGTFREDLYYRLFVAPVELPPLRQRVADIMPLAEYFAAQLTPGETHITFAPAARVRLESHGWHGNARELRNVVQLALLNRQGSVVTAEDLVFRPSPRQARVLDAMRTTGRTLDEIEKEAYRMALQRHDGDRKAAMEELGVARSTFFRKMEEFGLTKIGLA
jgi:two-component system response regulator HydG